MARGRLRVNEAAAVAREIARAMAKAHDKGIVHRDLKPENVMLRASGDAVLLDFGFARHAHYPDLLGEEQQRLQIDRA